MMFQGKTPYKGLRGLFKASTTLKARQMVHIYSALCMYFRYERGTFYDRAYDYGSYEIKRYDIEEGRQNADYLEPMHDGLNRLVF